MKQQEDLLLGWEELLPDFGRSAVVACCDLLRSLGGITPVHTVNLNSRGITGYAGQIRPLAEDIHTWLDEGLTVVLLSGGVARGSRLRQALMEQELHPLLNEADQLVKEGGVTILPLTISHGFLWEEGRLAVVSDTDIYGTGYRKARSRKTSGEKISAFT